MHNNPTDQGDVSSWNRGSRMHSSEEAIWKTLSNVGSRLLEFQTQPLFHGFGCCPVVQILCVLCALSLFDQHINNFLSTWLHLRARNCTLLASTSMCLKFTESSRHPQFRMGGVVMGAATDSPICSPPAVMPMFY